MDFLRLFQFQRSFIQVQATPEGGLRIEAHGPQVHVMGFEIHVLSIVNELYLRRLQTPDTLPTGRQRLQAKIAQLRALSHEPVLAHPFELSDFGLRRRFSEPWHREVVSTLTREVPQWFKGTSSVLLAKQLGIAPLGTMAHEYMQSYQSLGVRLRDFQKSALEDWVQQGLQPDLTLLFDVPLDVASQRMAGSRQLDRFEQEKADFHQRVRSAYLQRAAQDARFRVLDATRSIAQLQQDIAGHLAALLEQP